MKRIGRPPVDPASPSASVHLKLAGSDYDRAEEMARKNRETLQDFIRKSIKRSLVDLKT